MPPPESLLIEGFKNFRAEALFRIGQSRLPPKCCNNPSLSSLLRLRVCNSQCCDIRGSCNKIGRSLSKLTVSTLYTTQYILLTLSRPPYSHGVIACEGSEGSKCLLILWCTAISRCKHAWVQCSTCTVGQKMHTSILLCNRCTPAYCCTIHTHQHNVVQHIHITILLHHTCTPPYCCTIDTHQHEQMHTRGCKVRSYE